MALLTQFCVVLAEWKPKIDNTPCSTSAAVAPQTMQSNSSSVVTCSKGLSSQHTMTSSVIRIRHVQDRSVQADSVDVVRPMRCAVSVADVAVEVGESLLASVSQFQNCEVVCLSPTVTVPLVIAASVQSNPEYAISMTGAATVQQSGLDELLPHTIFEFQGRPWHPQSQTEHSSIVEHLANHDSDHIRESSPVIVIVPDESASPACQLSCDEHSSYERNDDVYNLLQSESSLSVAHQVV